MERAGRTPTHLLSRVCLAPFLAALLALGVSTPLRAQKVQVIVNPEVKEVPTDRAQLRAIFTMRVREWGPDGPPIRVFVLPDSDPLSRQFYRDTLGMYSYVLRSLWDRMVFTGTGLAPTVVRSEAEMRERVRETPGAIGYVSEGTGFRRWRFPQLAALHAQAPAKE